MASSVLQPNLPTPLLVSDVRPKHAKVAPAEVRKAEKDVLWGELGKCLVFVCYDAGLSLKEFAALVGKDERQMSRQMEGQERPQIEAVFAVPQFRVRLIEALARITPECSVETEIKFRRSA